MFPPQGLRICCSLCLKEFSSRQPHDLFTHLSHLCSNVTSSRRAFLTTIMKIEFFPFHISLYLLLYFALFSSQCILLPDFIYLQIYLFYQVICIDYHPFSGTSVPPAVFPESKDLVSFAYFYNLSALDICWAYCRYLILFKRLNEHIELICS